MTDPLPLSEACENCGAMIPGGRELDRLRAQVDALRTALEQYEKWSEVSKQR